MFSDGWGLIYNLIIQVEYHELETTFNRDSSSISVVEPQFSMENLQVMIMIVIIRDDCSVKQG